MSPRGERQPESENALLHETARKVGSRYHNHLQKYLLGETINDTAIMVMPSPIWEDLLKQYGNDIPRVLPLVTAISEAEWERDTQPLPVGEVYRNLFFKTVKVASDDGERGWEDTATQYLLSDILRYRLRLKETEGQRVSVPPEVHSLLKEVGFKRGLLHDTYFSNLYVASYEQVISDVLAGKITIDPFQSDTQISLTSPQLP